MTYTNEYLVNKAINGTSIGKWKGTDVIPISKNGFEKLFEKSNGNMNSNFYLIYDNGMKIIKDNRVCATMDRNGNMVNQNAEGRTYYIPKVVTADPPAADFTFTSSSTPGTEYDMSGVLNDVDIMLKEACAWQD